MRIRIINPNTTFSMTETIAAAARAVAAQDTEIMAATSLSGAVSIESHYDEALSIVGLVDEIREGEAEETDAFIIACFGDPGLLAARELQPVRAGAEAASMRQASLPRAFQLSRWIARIIAEHRAELWHGTSLSRRACHQLPVLEPKIKVERAHSRGMQKSNHGGQVWRHSAWLCRYG
jgi:allantoin racemase